MSDNKLKVLRQIKRKISNLESKVNIVIGITVLLIIINLLRGIYDK